MNKHLKYFLSVFISFLLAMGGCVDDRLYHDDGLQDGYSSLTLEASFQPFETSDLTRAGGFDGRSMKGLSDLAVILYNENGEIVEGYPQEIEFSQDDLKEEKRNNSNTADNLEPAEERTYSLKDIKLKNIPFGKYYIIAVANLGNYDGDNSKTTLSRLNEEYKDEIKTLDGLRKINLEWDNSNIMNNRQMLGFFADPDAEAPKSGSSFPLINVNRPGINLKAWLRRAASKITVDIDGSNLRENIWVYVKDVKIYDIAGKCTLGFGKEDDPDDVQNYIDYNNSIIHPEDLITDISKDMSENRILFCKDENSDPTKWPCITRGVPYIKNAAGTKANLHSETSPAIFFYENMQGNAPHGKIPEANLENDNSDVVDKDGTATTEYNIANFKDGINNGTYIEVEAYYISDTGDQSMTSGHTIKYRFMLGKDVEKSCDVERNIHYKLTLRLRGNAKEYDWHIEYKENEGFDVPNPWYVSYLYNHKSMMPFKFTPKDGWELQNVEAEIIVNPWYPYIEPTGENKDEQEIEENKYIGRPAGEMVTDHYDAAYTINKATGNGFLSLRSTLDKVILTVNDVSNNSFGYNDGNAQFNQAYFEGKYPTDGTAIPQNKRTYSFNGTADDTNTGEESYSYVKNGNVYTFSIPLFTRQKALVKQTGYSGNNYFAGYPRRAKLKLTALVKNTATGETEEVTKIVNVIQVRRIENPKGIYRKAGNNEDFHVRLLHLQGEDKTNFTDFDSRGPWLAEVVGDQNFITIDGKQAKYGSTGTNIDFTIRFNKTSTSSDKTPKNAIVRILYHNYTCTHLIFVRQGYDPQQISGKANQLVNGAEGEVDGAYWGTFNMIAPGVAATDPRDEGSLFRFGNATDAIDAVNNIYGDTNGNGDGKYTIPSDSEFTSWNGAYRIAATDEDGKLTNSTTKNWTDIEVKPDETNEFTNYKIATVRNYEQLYKTPFVQFGFGVLYADGATDTQYDLKQAFGYYREAKDNTRGIRGLFAYYWNPANPGDEYTAHNVFFPIGRSGYGHRKNGKSLGYRYTEDQNNWGKGILRYSCGRYEPALSTFGASAPIFVNLYRRQGAIYWSQKIEQNWLEIDGLNDKPNERAVGLDINYFSMDVNGINEVDIDVNDACFVRLMK